MVLPWGFVPILLGMSFGGFVGTLVRAVAIIVIGSVLFHVTYTITQLPLFLLIFGVGIIALYGLGVTFASVFLMWGREAWHMAELFMEPVFLASGFYFPVRALGFWVGMGPSIFPLPLALDAVGQLFFPQSHPALLPGRAELGGWVGLAGRFILVRRWYWRKWGNRPRGEG